MKNSVKIQLDLIKFFEAYAERRKLHKIFFESAALLNKQIDWLHCLSFHTGDTSNSKAKGTTN